MRYIELHPKGWPAIQHGLVPEGFSGSGATAVQESVDGMPEIYKEQGLRCS